MCRFPCSEAAKVVAGSDKKAATAIAHEDLSSIDVAFPQVGGFASRQHPHCTHCSRQQPGAPAFLLHSACIGGQGTELATPT